MKTFFSFFLAFAFSTGALAQTSETTRVSKGDLLKQRQYQTTGVATTGDLTFYVDPLGNNANQCTSTGVNACLTIQGALNKAPKLLRNLVTVNIAAGNYQGFIISGFTVDPSVQKTSIGILIDGVLGNVTPATGSATGTATAGSAGANTTYGTLTDSGATWTVNDLKGKFVTITGGTGSGQVKVITSNTATAITIAGTWTAPTGTSTYAIQYPTSIITSTAAAVPNPITTSSIGAAGLQLMDVQADGLRVTVRNIAFSSITPINTQGTATLQCLQCAFTGSGIISSISSKAALFTAISYVMTSNNAFQCTGAGTGMTIQNSLIQTNNGAGVSSSGGCSTSISSSQLNVGTSGLAQSGTLGGAGVGGLTSVRCDCGSVAGTSCLSVGGGSAASFQGPGSATVATGLDVTNCTYGVGVTSAGSSISFTSNTATFTGNALTYAAVANYGGQIILPTTSAITAGTSELAVDLGALTDTFASLTAAFSCLTSISTTSSICRQ